MNDRTKETSVEELQKLLGGAVIFVAAWASEYAEKHGLVEWHETHLAIYNKICRAIGEKEMLASDTRP